MVDTIDFVGEFTASELEQQKTQIQLQIDDLDEKLTHYIA